MKGMNSVAKLESKVPVATTAIAERVAAVLGAQVKQERSDKNWLMIVRESDLLFVSWPVPVSAVRSLVTPALEIDTFDGSAWVTVETLRLDTVKFRNLPLRKPIQGVEVNVRTYVRWGDVRGVCFLSLDCPGAIGNALNRAVFNLPFHTAEVRLTVAGDNYHVDSIRLERGAQAVAFAASARIKGNPRPVTPGSIEEFLLTQTTLFGVKGRGGLFRGDVAHRSRVIQPVEGIVESNTLTTAAGIPVLNGAPLIHYSPGDDSLAWPFKRITASPIKA
jgi:uncharacterized protein YqjF (DUF2071 family)